MVKRVSFIKSFYYLKRYFKLNYEQILNSLNPSLEKTFKARFKKSKSKDLKKAKLCFQKISNNKKININNLDKELSSSIAKSTQPQLDEKSVEFRNDITELRDIIIQATGESPTIVDMAFKPLMYREIIKKHC